MNVQTIAARWLAGDPDPDDRAELNALLRAGDNDQLATRFSGRLRFGTAGLRGAMGAGSNRMNTAVIRQTTAGLAQVLCAQFPDAQSRGVVVGYDARHRSQAFAEEASAVLLAAGFKVYGWSRCTPTPMIPWMMGRVGAVAGIVVTASHNPPADNGYKVYWDHGAQIVPPVDAAIAQAIETVALKPASTIPVVRPSSAHEGYYIPLSIADEAAYRAAVLTACPHVPSGEKATPIVYTAMHGVGTDALLAVLRDAGFSRVIPVPEQCAPDGSFPTVAFPNPEEAGALDLAIACAETHSAQLLIANDPDADRLSVALPVEGGWRQLTGNEVGALLADYCLSHDADPSTALLVNSVVSSEMLGALCAAHGARFEQTLTGFKWIAERARTLKPAGHRFIFGFEEALGYSVGETVADKDGVSAALALCARFESLRREGQTLVDRLEALYAEYGCFVTDQRVARFAGIDAQAEMSAAVVAVRNNPPQQVGGLSRRTATYDPEANLVTLRYADGDQALRVLVRPSGTEPKVKTYFEWRGPPADRAQLGLLIDDWQRTLGA
jgi:phosphomannomutase